MLNILCVLVHILTLCVIVKVWRWNALAHPATYFSGIWLVSVLSEWYLLEKGVAILIEQSLIDELNIFSLYTSLCFLFFSIAFRKKKIKEIYISIVNNRKRFVYYLYFCLFLVVINFFIKGASLSFGQNRLKYTGDNAHVLNDATPVDALISIFTSPLLFFTIFTGIEVARVIMNRSKLNLSKSTLCLPFFITFINSLIIGGRNPIAISIKQYLFGIGLGISSYYLLKRQKVKIYKLIFVFVIGFSLMSTMIAQDRVETFGFSKTTIEEEPAFISMFSGVMDYMSAHYWGYQLRRMDVANGENLEYGLCTFYGLGNISIPFSGILGLNGNLWEWLGVDYKTNDVYLSEVEGYYTTSTIFSLLVRDFGIPGIYFAILLLTLLSHIVFVRTINRKHCTALSLIPIILVLTYWSSSNFNSGFANLQPLLIGAIIFDLLQNNYKRIKK